MKKVYQCSDWKRHSKRRSLKELARRRLRKKIKKFKKRLFKGVEGKRFFYRRPWQIKEEEVLCPAYFSIIQNPEEMAQFFVRLESSISDGCKLISLNFNDVSKITEDSILYLLSFFNRHKNIRFRGTYPKDKNCSQLLIDSGFFETIKQKTLQLPSDPNIFTIKFGNFFCIKTIISVINFLMTKFQVSNPTLMQTQFLYRTFIECMVNTKNHAYRKINQFSKWWIIAQFNPDTNVVHFTFLDNGFGIPVTVRKYLGEKIRAKFIGNDAGLIKSTLKGEGRTQTRQRHRGKGLPSIFEFFNFSKISNLIVVSNKGYYNCETGQALNLKGKFKGTIISWDVDRRNII
ncbi:MAG: hypothetical protein F9K48_00665 [Candidatus Brocadia sp.]|nr:MAG: hypothetical protein F9K48_00665 [Candidatus Brocadia sp.]